MMSYDVVIIGGGPAGLSAALLLGRSRKRVLLCETGPARNAAATEVHNFVTRDGTPPAEIRRIAREQLVPYPSVEVRDARVTAVTGTIGAFEISLAGEAGPASVTADRIILGTGMVDEHPELPGYGALWGKAVFQCPYCHGWEARDRRFGCLATTPAIVEWSLLLRGWTDDVVAFTGGAFAVDGATRARLAAAGIGLEERPLAGLIARGDQLDAVELADGTRVARDVLFARPAQRHTPLVASLGLELDDAGYLVVDDHLETSRPGIHASGDLLTPKQFAIGAAASGTLAAAFVNHALTVGRLTT